MGNYNNTLDASGKLSREDEILAVDYDTEFDAIQTAINSKIDVLASPTAGNLVEEAAGGEQADSGISAANLAGLTGVVQTQLDALVSIEAQATDHIRAGNFQLFTGTHTGEAIESTSGERTVGPTGSGKDHIIAAMDNIPAGAQFAIFLMKFETLFTSAGAFNLQTAITKGDVATPTTSASKDNAVPFIHYHAPRSSANNEQWRVTQTLYVPLDSSLTFRFRNIGNAHNSGTSPSQLLIYKGFIA